MYNQVLSLKKYFTSQVAFNLEEDWHQRMEFYLAILMHDFVLNYHFLGLCRTVDKDNLNNFLSYI